MADLQLVPNPAVIAVQTGLFFGAMVVVKKLYVEPYLALKKKRDAATVGNKDIAAELLEANANKKLSLEEKVGEAADKARQIVQSAREDAAADQQSIIGEAEAYAASTLENFRIEVAKQLQDEKAKVPGVVASLSEKVYRQAVK